MSDVAKRQERSEEQKEQEKTKKELNPEWSQDCLLYTSPSPRDS